MNARRGLALLLSLAGAAACGDGRTAERAPLEVYAAASLRDALNEIAADYEERTGVELALNFGGSGALSRQILAARAADVFLSAGELEMDRLQEAGLVEAPTRRTLLSNSLVVIEPAARESLFDPPFEPADLADPRLEHLSIAHPENVPAGRYAKQWLERAGLWDALAPRVVPAIDVRAALAAVESGVARAGVVYASDAAITERVRVIHRVPDAQAPPIAYPAAVLAGRPRADEAARFLEHLAGRAALDVFERHGFRAVARDGGS